MDNDHDITPADAVYPVQVFYDGACPLCSREARLRRRQDVGQRLEFIDISAADFDAAAYGLDPRRVNEVMHVRTADGKVHTEVDALCTLRRALPPTVWSGITMALLRLPGAMGLAGVFYRLFAHHRRRLTGRCSAETCSPTARPS